MSRFWGGQESDDSDNHSDDDAAAKPAAKTQQSRVQTVMMQEGNDSDDNPRVIKTDREKKLDAIKATCREIRNKIKIGDWNAIRRGT